MHVGHQDQLCGAQRHGHLGRDGVGVDVVRVAVVAEADGGDDRRVAALQHRPDRLGVDLHHAAHEAERRVQLFGDDAGPVLAGHAHGLAAEPVDRRHQVRVDLAGEDHLHDVHGLGVGHPQATAELGLDAQPVAERRDLGAAAMHQHGLHPDVAQQHEVQQRLVPALLDRVAAHLDHHDLAVEPLDVRQRFDQHFGALGDRQCHVV